MCTLTFHPNAHGFILTSNRDEAPGRATLVPKEYTVEGVKLVFPKDVVAGGTWIGLSEKDRLICLLNGGFEAHRRESAYRLSRGVVVKDLLISDDVISSIDAYDLNGVEPFTLILVKWESDLELHELVWDGEKKHLTQKPLEPTIWSSSLLYTSEVRKKREHWFEEFLKTKPQPTASQLLRFHRTAGSGDLHNDLVMDRKVVRTKSISQVIKKVNEISMTYQEIE